MICGSTFYWKPGLVTGVYCGYYDVSVVINLVCALDQTSSVNKIKTLERSLTFLLDCQQSLAALSSQLSDDVGDDVTLQDEAMKLATIVESRLQSTLLNLIKNVSAASGKNRYTQCIRLLALLYCQAYGHDLITLSRLPSLL